MNSPTTKSRFTPMRFFLYRLFLPTAVAAYSNVSRQGYFTRQCHTHSHQHHDVVKTYPNNKIALPASETFAVRSHYPARSIVSYRAINSSLKSTKNEINAKSLSTADIQHIKLAARLAGIGKGNTYPNPAVGCVLVRHESEDVIVGSGLHPRYVIRSIIEVIYNVNVACDLTFHYHLLL